MTPDSVTEQSPLAMISRDPKLTRLVTELQRSAQEIQENPNRRHRLTFSRSELAEIRSAFGQTIIKGEAKLHRFCALLSKTLFQSEFELSSVVIGEVVSSRERFTLVQRLNPQELSRHTDLDLGNRQLERIRFHQEGQWSRSTLVANFVEYQPVEGNRWGVHKLISRIKAEEEIWNKVADEIFQVDHLVKTDKELRHLSRYVKDIFGVKILITDKQAAHRLQKFLRELHWSEAELNEAQVPISEETRRFQIVEEKDYLDQKESGWSAIKSVLTWWDATLEIQLQPLRNYLRERERLTTESHAGFKARREILRERLSEALPLYGFYRELLRWLFLSPRSPRPEFPSVSIEVVD